MSEPPGEAPAPATGPAVAEPDVPTGLAANAELRQARGPRRRRTRWRAAFFALAGLVIAGAVAWALLGDRLLIVRSVSVTGTRLLTPAQVTAAAGLPLGTPLLSVDAGAVTRRVEAINQVASASVTSDWPDHVTIAVTERVPVMAVRMAGGGYDQVDKAGVVVLWTKARPAALPLFTTALSGGALRGDPSVSAVTDVLTEVEPWLGKQVAQVRAAAMPAGAEQVTLSLRDGKTIQWGSPGDAARKNRELDILRDSKARSIDVSAPGTLVVKLSEKEKRAVPPLWGATARVAPRGWDPVAGG